MRLLFEAIYVDLSVKFRLIIPSILLALYSLVRKRRQKSSCNSPTLYVMRLLFEAILKTSYTRRTAPREWGT